MITFFFTCLKMISVLLKTGMGLFEILKLYFPIKQTFIKIASVFFIEKPTLPFYLVYILRLKSVYFHNSYILWLWEYLKKDIFITMSFLLTLWISFFIHLQCEKGFAFMYRMQKCTFTSFFINLCKFIQCILNVKIKENYF